MNTILLDTDVVSYLFKEDSRSRLYAPYLLSHELAIAMMTVAELYQWTSTRPWGKRRVQHLETWLTRFTVLPVDIESCPIWALVRTHRATLGLPVSPHNAGDYQYISHLNVISEQ